MNWSPITSWKNNAWLLHMRHWKLMTSWLIMCGLIRSRRHVLYLHEGNGHLNMKRGPWIIMWRVRLFFCVNAMLHSLHLYGRSPTTLQRIFKISCDVWGRSIFSLPVYCPSCPAVRWWLSQTDAISSTVVIQLCCSVAVLPVLSGFSSATFWEQLKSWDLWKQGWASSARGFKWPVCFMEIMILVKILLVIQIFWRLILISFSPLEFEDWHIQTVNDLRCSQAT